MEGVVGPHRGRYLSDGAEVLLDGAFPGWVVPRGQKADSHSLSEHSEEWNVIIDALEVQGYMHPVAEFAPLFTIAGIFFVD